jgi:ABC-type phosphate transport system substrate-binding protein
MIDRRALEPGRLVTLLMTMAVLFFLMGAAHSAGSLDQGRSSAETFKLIVNPEVGVSRLSQEELARMFLGKKTLWESGTRITPAMLDESTSTATGFIEGIVRRTVSQYQAYWKRQLFSGGGTAPKTFRNSAQVIDYVAKNPGAIGVVEVSAADDRVRVVAVEN